MQSAFEATADRRALYRQAALGLAVVAATALVALQLAGLHVSPVNAGLVELLLVLLAGSSYGIRAGVVSAGLGALVFNYFFLTPIFGLGIADPQHIAAVPVFLIAGVIGASLSDSTPMARARETTLPTALVESSVLVSKGIEREEMLEPPLRLDASNRQVFVEGSEVRLTPTEFSLLQLFVENRGRVLTRDTILGSVWGEEYVGDVRILRTYINQLRTKLNDNATAPRFIRTEPGFGYRFVGPGS